MKPCQNTQARYFGGAAVISPIIEFRSQILRGAAAAWSQTSSGQHAPNDEKAHIGAVLLHLKRGEAASTEKKTDTRRCHVENITYRWSGWGRGEDEIFDRHAGCFSTGATLPPGVRRLA